MTQRTGHGYLPGTSRGGPPGRRAVAATLGGGLILWASAAPAVPAIAAYAAPAAQTHAAPAAAQTHAAAASTGAGTLRAWGDNEDGQLGDGTITSRQNPVKVRLPGGTTVTSVRAGCETSVAVTSTGRVLAWGVLSVVNNIVAISHVPVRITLPGRAVARTVRVGCSFSLILTTAGHVLAWGANDFGQLGNGTTTSTAVPAAVHLPDSTKIKAISTGCHDSLALTTTGKLLAWGYNAFGQLGNGTTNDSAVPVKVAVPPGTRIAAVSAGCDHVLALTTTGKVLAWGENSHGQLGNGTTTSTDSPVTLPGTGRVKSLFAGCAHSLALTTRGKVLAWGYNAFGQLGNGTTSQSDSAVKVKVPAGTHVRAIAASCLSSLALTPAGHVLAWGDNGDGELGDGTTTSRSTPVKVHLAAGLIAIGIGGGPDAVHSSAIVRRAK